ncbi:unnamed protein product [Sphagnum jensenii]|uniref:Uncharacterized protein n=1 Tax=Sphagnum jensenii TaxID=128206 RepID=A0ABP1ALP0_9BRYO
MAAENEKREKNLKDQMVKEAEDFAEENERRIKAMWVESENMEKKLEDQMEERLSQELDKQTSTAFYFEERMMKAEADRVATEEALLEHQALHKNLEGQFAVGKTEIEAMQTALEKTYEKHAKLEHTASEEVATRKICETELQAVQARLKSATKELADKEIHLAQERRRSLQLEIAERDIRGFMNDLQSNLQTVKQNDEASIQKIVTLDQLVLYTIVLSSILLSYVRVEERHSCLTTLM